MKSPRVGFVLHNMQVAGAEMLVAQTIRYLSVRIEPTVICLDGIGALGETVRAEGVAVEVLGRRPGRDWRTAWKFARLVRDRNLQVLHAHQYTPFFYAALARCLSGRNPRIIFTEHGRHFPDRVSPLRRGVNRLVLDACADKVNAVCAFSARSLCRIDGFAGRRIQVIPNGVERTTSPSADHLASLRRELGLSDSRRYIVCVARFHPVKDHETLLRSFAILGTSCDNVDLLLLGDGDAPRRESLQALAASLGIAERVHFLGVRKDVAAILRLATLFLLTSVSEAAPLTVLEAMAAGLPVVLTDVGGNSEIVRHGKEGLLAPRGDAAAIAAACKRLLDDPGEHAAMGSAGAERVRSRYRIEDTLETYYQLYVGGDYEPREGDN